MRLDKFIAQQLGVSRAIAGREIRGSRVTVDGDIVKDASFKLQPEHEVEYDGNTLTQQNGPRYFMLNKPQGYVCSTDDPDHPTILYFLDEPVAHKLHAAGRLDIDTTGLVLMTDDGQWSHRITSPRHHCEKTYLVALESPLAVRLPLLSMRGGPLATGFWLAVVAMLALQVSRIRYSKPTKNPKVLIPFMALIVMLFIPAVSIYSAALMFGYGIWFAFVSPFFFRRFLAHLPPVEELEPATDSEEDAP